MNTANWIAASSAAIAATSAYISHRQARSSKASAEMAERQAVATEQQAEVQIQQFFAQQDAAKVAAAPRFRATEARLIHTHENYIEAVLQMVSGAPLNSVVITADCPELRGLVNSVGDYEPIEAITWENVSSGGRCTVAAWIEWRLATDRVDLRLNLKCHERGTNRTWDVALTVPAEVEKEPEYRGPSWMRRKY